MYLHTFILRVSALILSMDMYVCMYAYRQPKVIVLRILKCIYILTVGALLTVSMDKFSYICMFCTVCMYVADTVSPSSSAGHPLKGKHRKSASMSALNYPALLPKSSEQVHIGKEGLHTNSGTDILSASLHTYIHTYIHIHILFTYKNIYINNKNFIQCIHTYIHRI